MKKILLLLLTLTFSVVTFAQTVNKENAEFENGRVTPATIKYYEDNTNSYSKLQIINGEKETLGTLDRKKSFVAVGKQDGIEYIVVKLTNLYSENETWLTFKYIKTLEQYDEKIKVLMEDNSGGRCYITYFTSNSSYKIEYTNVTYWIYN